MLILRVHSCRPLSTMEQFNALGLERRAPVALVA